MRHAATKSNTVLIVDDDSEICDALQMAVSMEGFDVRVSESQSEALEIVQLAPPALILLDYYGVGNDTKRFVRSVRGYNSTIPIVLMTGAKDPSAKCRELNLKHYLAKPFEIESLQKILRDLAPAPAVKKSSEAVCFSLFA